jgi:hypothetical protein
MRRQVDQGQPDKFRRLCNQRREIVPTLHLHPHRRRDVDTVSVRQDDVEMRDVCS